MHTEVAAVEIGRRLIDCFNRRPGTSVADLCDRSTVVHSALLGRDRRSNAVIKFPLAALIAACHARFPGIEFHPEGVTAYGAAVALSWRGRFQAEGQQSTITVPCACRIRIANNRLCEISFAVDDYSILMQLGSICAEPGQSRGRSASVNEHAAASLRDAFVMRKDTCDAVSAAAVIHANIETYADITCGIAMDTFRLEGAGTIGELLCYVREHFGAPIDVAFRDGISQGYATTFRGKIRARIGAEMQRYDLVCGFASPGDRLAECWVKITPPPTLMECLI